MYCLSHCRQSPTDLCLKKGEMGDGVSQESHVQKHSPYSQCWPCQVSIAGHRNSHWHSIRLEKMLWFLVACPAYIRPWVQTHNQVIGSLKLPPGICMGRSSLPWAGQLALSHYPLGHHLVNMPGLGVGPELVSFLRLYVLC